MNASDPCGIEAPPLAELLQKSGQIYAWLYSLAPASADGLTPALLSAGERERAQRFHFERDRTRYIFARSGMRKILGSCLGILPGQICFRYGTKGKPEIAEPSSGLHFNLSHSGDWAILAISGVPVGVDLEAIDTRVRVMELAQRFFSGEDSAWLLAQPEEHRHRAFFRLWVTREAWLKATGDGLAFPLDQLVTERTGEAITALREHTGSRKGEVLELSPLPPGYCAAVALEHATPQVILNHLLAL